MIFGRRVRQWHLNSGIASNGAFDAEQQSSRGELCDGIDQGRAQFVSIDGQAEAAVRAGVVTAFAALLLLGAEAEAVAPSEAEQLRVVRVDAAQSPDLTVDVIVPRRSTGRDLPASAFEVVVDGESIPVRASRLAPNDLDVMIAIAGPALSNGAVLTTLQAATTELIRMLPDGARIGLTGGGAPAVPLTTDRQRVLDGVAGLDVGDLGGIDGAIDDAAQALRTQLPRRPAVVLISQGGDLDPAAFGRVVAGFDAAEPLVFSVVLAGAENTGDLADVELPGGGVARAAPLTALVGATDAVVADLVGRYRLTFELPALTATGVEVRLADDVVVLRAPVPLAPVASETAAAGPSPVYDPLGGEGSPGPSHLLRYVVVGGLALILLGSWVAGMAALHGSWVGGMEPRWPRDRDPLAGGALRAPVEVRADVHTAPHRLSAIVLLADRCLAAEIARQLAACHVDATAVGSALDALREVLARPAAILVVEAGLPRVDELVLTVGYGQLGERSRVVVVTVAGNGEEALEHPAVELADRIVESRGGREAIVRAIAQVAATSGKDALIPTALVPVRQRSAADGPQ
jgi:hypothetical protein